MSLLTEPFRQGRDAMRASAIAAAHALGVFQRLADGQDPVDEALLRPHRWAALLELLVAEGVITKGAQGWACVQPPGLPGEPISPFAERLSTTGLPGPLGGYHHHLSRAAAESSRAIAGVLAQYGGSLLDVGAGLGHHSLAFLDWDATHRATIVELPAVIGQTRTATAGRQRIELRAGNAVTEPIGDACFDVALLSHVIHWHDADGAKRMLANVVRALKPGAGVVVQEIDIDPGHGGPLSALYFNLSLSAYSSAGRVPDRETLADWVRGAGVHLESIGPTPGAEDCVLLVGSVKAR